MQCSSCGSTAPRGKRFCADCGAVLRQQCPVCGSESLPGKKFCADCGTSLLTMESAAVPPPPAEPATTFLDPESESAERRQITVLFCDLVDSTALSTRLDPEDLRDVIRAFRTQAEDVIRRHDGFVAKFMGDGLLAYFGYPHAFEDDAEQGVRAGIALVGAIRKIKIPDGQLQARVGIATGLAIVGDLIGSGSAQERGVIGETPNLAARLQSLAAPGTVVISSSTRRLTGDLFTYRDLGAFEMKGFRGLVPAWQVIAESKLESRFEALRPRQCPLVGRDNELKLLLHSWTEARSGRGRVVLISGEPGIGKSRLAAALLEIIQAEPHIRLRYFCSPHASDSALHPVISRIERAAGFSFDDSAEAKRGKLMALLEPSSPTAEEFALLATLLSIADGDPGVASLTPQKRKELTLLALCRQFGQLARRRPILMVWEDIHWIDPTSLDLLDRLIERAAGMPVLVVATFRSDFTPPWQGQAHIAPLALNRLDRSANLALLNSLTDGKQLTSELIDEIMLRTEGVPLFVEELTKAVLENGALSEQTDQAAADGSPILSVPDTLQASLMARLDRIAPAREVAQIGAAIGREFSFELVAAISGRPTSEVEMALDQLETAGLVTRRGVPPEAHYIFKHVLVQDAAHDSLLRRRRRLLHARIARALEQQRPELVQTQPEVLAYHFTEACLWVEAATYWCRAATQALNRSANREAFGHLTRGLKAAGKLPPSPERANIELDLQLGVASASIAIAGYAADSTESAYLAARDIVADMPADTRQFAVLYGLFVVNWNRAQLEAAHAIAGDLLVHAEELGDPVAICVGNRALAVAENAMARFHDALEHATEAINIHEAVHQRASAVQYGHDIGVAAVVHQALAQGFLGDIDQSTQSFQRALTMAHDLGHANTIGYAEMWTAFMQLSLGDMPGAADRAQNLVRFSEEQGMAFWLAIGRCMLGGAVQALGRPEDGLKWLDDGLAALAKGRVQIFRPALLCLRAQALVSLGRSTDAVQTLDMAIKESAESQERWWQQRLADARAALP